VLFPSAAMYDDPEQVDAFNKLYCKKLGCELQVLNLVRKPSNELQIGPLMILNAWDRSI
jgi:hypothetical protein